MLDRKESPDYHKKPCKVCGNPKEYGYRNSGRCSACTEVLRKAKRTYEKKGAHGTGRSILCSTCKKPKEEGRDNESRCKSCKSSANKQARAEKRAKSGLKPFGSGRKETCSKCNAVKENISFGYCNACNRERDKAGRLRRGETLKLRTGKCQCGKEFASFSKCYCVDCHREKSEEYRRNNPDKIKEIRKRAALKQKSNPDNWVKVAARRMTRTAIQKGILVKDMCEMCGPLECCSTFDSVQAHHDDYTRPLVVRWLCSRHHAEHHKNLKQED